VPAGAQVVIPMTSDNSPAGPPSSAQPYNDAAMANLPALLLPRNIVIRPALTEEELASSNDVTGEWVIVDFRATCERDDPRITGNSDFYIGKRQRLETIDDTTIRGETVRPGAFLVDFTAELTEEGYYLVTFDEVRPTILNEYKFI
jgi:hypothetical protein